MRIDGYKLKIKNGLKAGKYTGLLFVSYREGNNAKDPVYIKSREVSITVQSATPTPTPPSPTPTPTPLTISTATLPTGDLLPSGSYITLDDVTDFEATVSNGDPAATWACVENPDLLQFMQANGSYGNSGIGATVAFRITHPSDADKRVTIRATSGGQTVDFSLMLQCAASVSALEITGAVYGIPDSGPTWQGRDVTDVLRALIDNNTLTVTVNNTTMGGDPLPKQAKQLKVNYKYNSVEQEAVIVAENKTLKLPLAGLAYSVTLPNGTQLAANGLVPKESDDPAAPTSLICAATAAYADASKTVWTSNNPDVAKFLISDNADLELVSSVTGATAELMVQHNLADTDTADASITVSLAGEAYTLPFSVQESGATPTPTPTPTPIPTPTNLPKVTLGLGTITTEYWESPTSYYQQVSIENAPAGTEATLVSSNPDVADFATTPFQINPDTVYGNNVPTQENGIYAMRTRRDDSKPYPQWATVRAYITVDGATYASDPAFIGMIGSDGVMNRLVSAYYSADEPPTDTDFESSGSVVNVYDIVKPYFDNNQSFVVSNSLMGGDPEPNKQKILWLTFANGAKVNKNEGTTVVPADALARLPNFIG